MKFDKYLSVFFLFTFILFGYGCLSVKTLDTNCPPNSVAVLGTSSGTAFVASSCSNSNTLMTSMVPPMGDPPMAASIIPRTLSEDQPTCMSSAPTITSISPQTGLLEGEDVKIEGTNFVEGEGNTRVFFDYDTESRHVFVVSSTELFAEIPPDPNPCVHYATHIIVQTPAGSVISSQVVYYENECGQ